MKKITAALMAMLGISTACDKNDQQPTPESNPSTFHIKGTVVADGPQSELDILGIKPGQAIPGIEVVIAPQGAASNYPRDTTYTNADGSFDLALESFGSPGPDFDVWLNDVDSRSNGLYTSRTTTLTLLQDGWSSALTQEGIVFQLYPYEMLVSGPSLCFPLTSLSRP